ncbi:MAG TPA: DegT/DnrJ/EryC1/StrS family aminotransferase, partial [Verrucomicrobiae bacterium]|nr:DegT/DnrJ/EryC1/StrS family aminotransferase [Verrucomicrobiae bacterium]
GRVGAKLVWADIDPETFLISAESIRAKLTPRTKVIVVVHLYGLTADMEAISALAKQHNCLLVEDCAQAVGATYRGKKAGTFGDFSAFSFHAQKNITTLGEGGMLVVRSPETAKLVPGLRHNGHIPFPGNREFYWKPAMTNVDVDIEGVWPYNFSLGEAQCALGSKLLDRLDQINAHRAKRGMKFRQALADYPELQFQRIPAECGHVHHLLPARFDASRSTGNRDVFIQTMVEKFRIKVIVQYYPLYRYPLFQKLGQGEHDCPATDAFFDNMVSFPFHEWMSDEDFDYMIESTRQTAASLRK